MTERERIIHAIQIYCADLLQSGRECTVDDGTHIALLLNRDVNPRELFRHIDEQTGAIDVGYRTRDGRYWFPVLRQMRNTPGSGLLEGLQ